MGSTELEQQAMQSTDPSSPVGSLVLLGILLFIVFRILQAINGQNQKAGGGGGGPMGGARVFHMPERKPSPPPPAAITLTPIDAGSSPFTAEVEAVLLAEKTLQEENGMSSVGDYVIEQMPGFSLRVFTSLDKNLVAILYHDAQDRVWLNLLTEYDDGRVVTTSSAEKEAIKQDRPRGMPLYNYPGLPFDQLFRRHKLETRSIKNAEPLTADRFPDFFISNYQKLREHLNDAASPRKASVTTLPPALDLVTEVELDLPSGDNYPPEPSSAQKKKWLDAIFHAVAISPKERDSFLSRLVWVVDNAPMDTIADTIEDYSPATFSAVEEGRWVVHTGKGEAEDIIEPGDLTGASLFDKVNAGLPEAIRFTKIEINEPGVTFYSAAQ